MIKKAARDYKDGDQLNPGDILNIITSKSAKSGHVVAVISHQGNRLHYVSGNAGGGGGSVRIDSVNIEKTPEWYNWHKVVSYKRSKLLTLNYRVNPGESRCGLDHQYNPRRENKRQG